MEFPTELIAYFPASTEFLHDNRCQQAALLFSQLSQQFPRLNNGTFKLVKYISNTIISMIMIIT